MFVVTGEISFKDEMRKLGKETPINHLGSGATIEQAVFVPAVYPHPSQQPVAVNEYYDATKDFQEHSPVRVQTA